MGGLRTRASRPQHAGGVGFSSIPLLAMTRLAPVVGSFAGGSTGRLARGGPRTRDCRPCGRDARAPRGTNHRIELRPAPRGRAALSRTSVSARTMRGSRFVEGRTPGGPAQLEGAPTRAAITEILPPRSRIMPATSSPSTAAPARKTPAKTASRIADSSTVAPACRRPPHARRIAHASNASWPWPAAAFMPHVKYFQCPIPCFARYLLSS